jgi:hypothetical protein
LVRCAGVAGFLLWREVKGAGDVPADRSEVATAVGEMDAARRREKSAR